MNRILHVYPSQHSLATDLAREFAQTIISAAAYQQTLHVALSGGSTPKILFKALSRPSQAKAIPWSNVHFYWGDERCVTPDHIESNFGMTRDSLLGNVDIPPGNIHRIHGEAEPIEEARRYSLEIDRLVPKNAREKPVFDWIFLGMGEDGHTASLFPMASTLAEKNKICTVAAHPQSGQQRVTFTMPTINAGKRISFLITGDNKAGVLKEIFESEAAIKKYPAAAVLPKQGFVDWFLDRPAASKVCSLPLIRA